MSSKVPCLACMGEGTVKPEVLVRQERAAKRTRRIKLAINRVWLVTATLMSWPLVIAASRFIASIAVWAAGEKAEVCDWGVCHLHEVVRIGVYMGTMLGWMVPTALFIFWVKDGWNRAD